MRQFKQWVKKWLSRGNDSLVTPGDRRPAASWAGLEGLENRVLMSVSIGGLSGTPNPVVIGGTLTLTATGVEDATTQVSKVEFVRDVNGNAVIDKGDQVLGFGKNIAGTDNWQLVAKTNKFVVGTDTVLAVAIDKTGAESPVASTTLTVSDAAPTIQKVDISTKAVANGNPFTLTAKGVVDKFAKVTSVSYYFDANGSGIPNPADLLGTATKAEGFKLDVTNPTGLPTTGTARFLAVATNANGTTSTVATVSIKAVAPPSIGTFSGSPNPATDSQAVTLTAGTVAASTGATIKTVAFYFNPNGNGAIDKNDVLLGDAKLVNGSWALSILPDKHKVVAGTDKFLAIATDSNGLVSAVASTTVTITA